MNFRSRRPFATLAAIAAFALTTPAFAQLSAPERTIVSTVDARFEADVALLEKIVRINSGSHNPAGVRAVADALIPEFRALGFETEWIDKAATGRAGHLFARHKGKRGTTRMLLIAHLDTVFEPSSPFQGFTRSGMSATGPGVDDDKGGIVILLAALRAMQAAGTLKDANITVALTGDEEDAGTPLELARAELVAAAGQSDVALCFESLARLNGKDMGSIARRSSNDWVLTTTSASGHSSGIFGPQAGYGAVYELARILDRFRRELPEENLTFNVGVMAGGTPGTLSADELSASAVGKGNIIPSQAMARGDLRALSKEQTDRAVAKMRAIVDDNLPGTDATFEFNFRYPPMAPTAGNRALLGKLNGVNADLGLEKMDEFPPALRGAADISFVAHLVDALSGFGPHGANSHAEGETVDLSTFPRQSKRAAILMSRLAKERRTGR